MKIDPKESFMFAWRITRGLTYDLLGSLSEEDLVFSPGRGLGPFWKQFRHIGGVQENYTKALETGKMDFGNENKTYSGGASKEELKDYFGRLEEKLLKKIESFSESDWEKRIFWSEDDKPTLYEHLMRLVEHETLHHGEWIVYVILKGLKFPESWEDVWGL